MRKGFLNGPPAKKNQKKDDEGKKEELKVAKPETKESKEEAQDTKVQKHETGAVPKQPPVCAAAGQTPPKSEGAAKAESGVAQVKTVVKKRRRTRSHNSSPSPGRGFYVPGYGGGAAAGGGMSLAELMDASRGLTNMALAHEIAVDKDFTLQKVKPVEGSMEKTVKEMMHKAFWDVLQEQLDSDPPEYSQAIVLLTEVKQMLFSVLLPQQHTKLKEGIDQALDIELVRQQVEQGVLDFERYAGYVLGLMGRLCAPVRDEKIEELKNTTKVVPLFKGIMETLELMKLDMANFTIQQARPVIVSQSVQYEKIKFKEFLSTQEDGLVVTREWLVRHAPTQEEIEDPKYKKLLGVRVLTEAYIEILEWDDYYLLPETLVMDHKRIVALRDQVERASVSTAVVLLAFSHVGPLVVPMDAQRLKESVKQHVDILLEEFHEDNDLLRILPNVAVQVVKDVNDYLRSKQKPELSCAVSGSLSRQLEELEDPNHRVRDLVNKRILDFNKRLIAGGKQADIQVPPGLSICQKDLANIASQFLRLVNYNKAVFGEFYDEIIENHCLFKVEA